jgi:hypothetical protein
MDARRFPYHSNQADQRHAPHASEAPPTRCIQLLSAPTAGIIGVNQTISASDMKLYEGIFATPIPMTVLAALVDKELPSDLEATPLIESPAGRTAAV